MNHSATNGASSFRGKPATPATALVRSLPLTMSIDEVEALAKKKGIKIDRPTIWGTRGRMKAKKKPGPKPRVTSPHERQLCAIVVELGMRATRELLEKLEARLQRTLEGG